MGVSNVFAGPCRVFEGTAQEAAHQVLSKMFNHTSALLLGGRPSATYTYTTSVVLSAAPAMPCTYAWPLVLSGLVCSSICTMVKYVRASRLMRRIQHISRIQQVRIRAPSHLGHPAEARAPPVALSAGLHDFGLDAVHVYLQRGEYRDTVANTDSHWLACTNPKAHIAFTVVYKARKCATVRLDVSQS
jgi:hypothetical protein